MRSIYRFPYTRNCAQRRGISVFFLLLLVLSLPQAPFGDDDDDGDQEINELAPNHPSDSQRNRPSSIPIYHGEDIFVFLAQTASSHDDDGTRTTTCLFLAHTVRQIIVDSIRLILNQPQPAHLEVAGEGFKTPTSMTEVGPTKGMRQYHSAEALVLFSGRFL